MTNDQPLAVLGATGAQGGPVARALLDAGRPVRVVVRDPARAAALADRGAEVAVADLADPAALRTALTGVAGAFTHLPFIPVADVIERLATSLAEALVAARVPLTAFTLSGPPATAPTGVASFDTKAIADRILRASGAPIVHLTPMGYLANLSAPFAAPWVVDHDELRYPVPADLRQRWVSVEDQAALAIAALDRPDLAGRTFALGEPRTGPELAAGIGAGLGRELRYVPVDPADFARDAFAPVMGEQLAAALVHDYAFIGSGAPGVAIGGDGSEVTRELGVAYTPLEEWARTQDWQGSAAVFRSLAART